MRTKLIISLSLILFTCFAFGQDNNYSFKEKYDVGSEVELNVSTSDGDVIVHQGSEGNIEVYYQVFKGNKFVEISREELENNIILDIEHNNNLLDISIRNKNENSWKNYNNQYNVSVEIFTPENTSCYLKSSDGDLKISGLVSDQKCKTSDGDIKIKKIKGSVDVVTSDGDIHAYSIMGNMEFETSDGDIHVEISEGIADCVTSDGDISIKESNGAFNASSSDGDIRLEECSGSLTASTSDGDIHCELKKVTGNVSMVTSDGDIDVLLPADLGMDLKMKGETLRTPRMEISGKIDENHIEGSVKGGGVPVKMITSDGTVTLSLN